MTAPVAIELSVVQQLAARLEDEQEWLKVLAPRLDTAAAIEAWQARKDDDGNYVGPQPPEATAWLERRERRPPFGEVLGALEAAALKTWPKAPAAIVAPLAQDAPEGVAPAVGAVQPVESTIAVTVIVAAPNDRTGATRRDELSALVGGARAMTAGWKPVGGLGRPMREALQFRRGRLVGLDGGRVEWRDEFSLRHVRSDLVRP